MFSFFKKRRTDVRMAQEVVETQNSEVRQEDAAVAVDVFEPLDVAEQANQQQEEAPVWLEPQTKLVFPEETQKNIPNELRYVLQFTHTDLPQLPDGVLSIDGYKIEKDMFALQATVFLRNNTEESVTLTYVPLILLDANNNMIARRVFNMQGLELQAKTAVPYRFDFYPEHMFASSADLSTWFIGFHMQDSSVVAVTSRFDFETKEVFSPAERVEEEDRRVYSDVQRALIETEGQIGFMVGRVDISEEGEHSVLLLVRNGCEEELRLPDNVSVTLLDGVEETVAEGLFDLSENPVPPLSVVSYTLTYPAETIQKADPDLSGWSVAVEMR